LKEGTVKHLREAGITHLRISEESVARWTKDDEVGAAYLDLASHDPNVTVLLDHDDTSGDLVGIEILFGKHHDPKLSSVSP
jgi:hypothetical protein